MIRFLIIIGLISLRSLCSDPKIDGTQSAPLGSPIGLLRTMYTRDISCQKAQSFSRTNGELSCVFSSDTTNASTIG